MPFPPLLAVSLVFVLPGAVLATVSLTAIRARIADQPAYVRAVVEFTDGSLRGADLTAVDPSPFADGRARLRLSRLRVRTDTAGAAGHGLRVRIVQGTNRLTIDATGTPRRLKYLGYRTLHNPERLVLDLWKGTPPAGAAEVRRGPHGCLSLGHVAAPPGRITAAGSERGLFEHSFQVVVRGADGQVLARRSVIAAGGRWSARVSYRVARRQAGTLEAVAGSAKDGSLVCLAQTRVTLAFPEAAP